MIFSDSSHNHHPQWPFSEISELWLPTSCHKVSRAIAVALLSSTVLIGQAAPLFANPSPVLVSQRSQQDDWEAELHIARLLDDDGEPTALVLQLDVDEKPETSYANAVYQLFANIDGRWTELYTNTGARLIGPSAGGAFLPPEVIELTLLEDTLEQQEVDRVDWNTLDLKATVQVRYDTRNRRDRNVEWAQEVTYGAIAQTYSSQIARDTTIRQTTTQVVTNTETSTQTLEPLLDTVGTPNNQLSPHRGHFSLGILQSVNTLSDVIARVSLKAKRPESYLGERLIGDFQYSINQRSQFIRGLNPGDRVVVRLFDTAGEFLGYSEFELLDENAAVNLVLSDTPWRDRLVRTVYGVDRDRNGQIDANAQIYDYFTHVTYTSQSYEESQVTFLKTTNNINHRAFAVSSLPSLHQNCSYPHSFQRGSFALANRTVSAFGVRGADALIARPGELVQITTVNSSSITHEVSRLILTHREVGYSDDVIVTTCNSGCIDHGDDEYEWDDDLYEWDDDDDDDD
ncbi:MAG: hypothetical protein F6K09_04335 [Merismopedia sp. SIO2A8]|nr:hypothetical protein [Merismopedia sp. SIO2A8]